MAALLTALIGILAAFGVVILLVLTLRSLGSDARSWLPPVKRWNGHAALAFFNHPPEAWAAP